MDIEVNAIEARILGCLVEKEATTPDGYPLTTNALVTACNQKTNRDPVVNFTAIEVDGALLALRQQGFVRAVHVQGSRSTKHRHIVPDALGLSEPQTAVLAVLLLRGAQTVGELRGRTERIHAFDSLDAVDDVLDSLADQEPPLVRQLARAPGQKEARWVQLMSAVEDSGAALPVPGAISGEVAAPGSPRTEAAPQPVSGGLAGEVAELRAELTDLRARFDALCELLGESPEPPGSELPAGS